MRGFLESAVVATVLQSGVGAGSGAPGEIRYTQVWKLRDGAVTRLETFRSREAAQAAFGLPT